MRLNDLEFLWKLRTKGLSEEVKARLLKGTGKNNSVTKRDYVYALAILVGYQRNNPGFVFDDNVTAQDIWLGVPETERYRLMLYTPCLAYQYDQLNEDEKLALFNNDNWVFTRKYTGIRCILVCTNGEFKIYSRNFSDDDCHCLEYSSKIYAKPNIAPSLPFVVDVEMILSEEVDIGDDLAKKGVYAKNRIDSLIGLIGLEIKDSLYIQKSVKKQFGINLVDFRLIAPIYFNGISYLKRTLGEGMAVYDSCVEYGRSLGLNINPVARCEGDKYSKTIFLNTILNEGGEGVVAQNKNGLYNTTDKRSKDSYVKIKHYIDQKDGLSDTFDGYVGGYKLGSNGLIDSLNIFVKVENGGKYYPHLIANVPIGAKLQKIITLDDNSGFAPINTAADKYISLNPEYYHKVVEIDGTGINAYRKIISPRLIRFRTDKNMDECLYSMDFILSQIKEKNNFVTL